MLNPLGRLPIVPIESTEIRFPLTDVSVTVIVLETFIDALPFESAENEFVKSTEDALAWR
jgi:hypothetical protein